MAILFLHLIAGIAGIPRAPSQPSGKIKDDDPVLRKNDEIFSHDSVASSAEYNGSSNSSNPGGGGNESFS
ncbi:MAG: hypothetical protein ACRCWR_06115, partial [Saezia sp.]